jgi:hypothetical protein
MGTRAVRRPGSPLTERAVNFIIKEAAERAGVNSPLLRFTSCVTPMRRTPSTTAGVVDKQLCPKGSSRDQNANATSTSFRQQLLKTRRHFREMSRHFFGRSSLR